MRMPTMPCRHQSSQRAVPDPAGVMAPALRPRVLEPDGHDSAQQPSQQSGDATFSSSEDQHSNQ